MNVAPPKPTVFIVDDDEEIRHSLKYLVESVCLPTEVFDSAEAFLDGFDPRRPGCLILDVLMPGMGGLRLLEWLRSQGPHLPVIVYTGHADVAMAVEALTGGAFHFLEKPARSQTIVHCIQDAIALDRERLAKAKRQAAIEERLVRLTPREQEVLERMIEGEANKCIAINLCISERTAEKHRGHVMEKMGTHSLAKLVHMKLLSATMGKST